MIMLMIILILTIGGLLILSGCMIRFKKAYWLISGYNTMPEEQKQHIDIEKMGRSISNCLFCCAAVLAAGGISLFLRYDLAGIILILLIFPIILVTLGLSQKHVHNEEQKKKSFFFIVGMCVFLAIIFTWVFSMLFTGSRPPEYTLGGGTLTISGTYGETVNLSVIKNIELKNELPEGLTKTNGFDLGDILKGSFRSDKLKLTLFVDASNPPFIYLTTADGVIILNDESQDKTNALFEQIKEAAYATSD